MTRAFVARNVGHGFDHLPFVRNYFIEGYFLGMGRGICRNRESKLKNIG